MQTGLHVKDVLKNVYTTEIGFKAIALCSQRLGHV